MWITQFNTCKIFFSGPLEEDIQVSSSASSDNEKIKMLEKMPKERDETIARMQQRLEFERFGVERFSKDNCSTLVLCHI